MTKSKFPKQIFVAIEGDGREQFFSAQEQFAAHADMEETKEVAIYTLERIAKVTGKAVLE